jgi:ethanolamine utilization protein EutQ
MSTTEKPALYKMSELQKKPFTPRGSSTNELMNDETGARIASGVVYFKDSEIPFTLWYDEVLICHAIEESFEIVVEGVSYPMMPGDMMWLPAGTSLIYRSKGTATAFYAVTPADWAKRRPQA